MAKTSRDAAPQVEKMDGFEGHYDDLGGYVAGFERYDADADPASLFVGLPDDACQCPHWGVVLRGRLAYRYTDGTVDEIGAGEAYYARPGHTPVFYADTEIVEFSPAEELQQTMEVVLKNLASSGAGA
jgi:hypothetical protein